MVKCERRYPAPESLNKHRSYNDSDVIESLRKTFHDKCYICELKDLTDIVVEHRIPNKNDERLKYDWENLFLACPHCNTWKNQSDFEDQVIDCCHEDPEKHILCVYEPQTGEIAISAKDGEDQSVATAKLIYNIFNVKNTGIRTNGSDQRVKLLQSEWAGFHRLLAEYSKNKSAYSRKKLEAKLRRESTFASFKRDYIRNNLDKYGEFQDLLTYG